MDAIAVFSLLSALFVISQFGDGSILFNEAVAMSLFCLSFPLKIYNVKVGQYVILFVLVILLFSPLSYSYTTTNGDTSVTHGESRFTSLISPLTFLILMAFLVFNYRSVIELYHRLTRGSEREQKEELSKNIEFYYNKFNGCSNTELVDIFKIYNDYPTAAQLALNRIKEEKEIN